MTCITRRSKSGKHPPNNLYGRLLVKGWTRLLGKQAARGGGALRLLQNLLD